MAQGRALIDHNTAQYVPRSSIVFHMDMHIGRLSSIPRMQKAGYKDILSPPACRLRRSMVIILSTGRLESNPILSRRVYNTSTQVVM